MEDGEGDFLCEEGDFAGSLGWDVSSGPGFGELDGGDWDAGVESWFVGVGRGFCWLWRGVLVCDI